MQGDPWSSQPRRPASSNNGWLKVLSALILATGGVIAALVSRGSLPNLPAQGQQGVVQAAPTSTLYPTATAQVNPVCVASEKTGVNQWGQYTVQVPDQCVLIVGANEGTVTEGSMSSQSFSNGAVLAFGSGAYTLTLNNGVYYVVPAAAGRERFCAYVSWVKSNDYALTRQQLLPGWASC